MPILPRTQFFDTSLSLSAVGEILFGLNSVAGDLNPDFPTHKKTCTLVAETTHSVAAWPVRGDASQKQLTTVMHLVQLYTVGAFICLSIS